MKHRIRGCHRAAWLGLCLLVSAAVKAAEPLTVYTVNYPLQYFAERIAGEHAAVVYPGPADEDPAFWVPDNETVQSYQQADLIILNGAGYARWVSKVSLPRARMVDAGRNIRERFIPVTEVATHSHGPGGEHAHTGTAFTLWLDFTLAVEQARAIRDALVRRQPEHAEWFDRNLQSLVDELMGLDNRFAGLVENSETKRLLASHPVYQYLARRYGLEMPSVTWEPDVLPNERQWRELEALAGKHQAGWFVWEGQPLSESVQRLETLGIRSIVLAPGSTRPADGDFLSLMERNLEALATALH